MPHDPPAARRLPRLRSKLLLLAAGSVVPLLVLSLVLGYFLIRHQQELFRQAALDRNRTFLTAVDAQLEGHVATLKALAASRSLEAADLQAFRDEAQRVLVSQPDWRNVLLLDISGRQLVNLRLAPGAPLPRDPDGEMDDLRRVVATRSTSIGNIALGPVTRLPGLYVRLPILRDDKVAYVLEFILQPDALERLMEAQGYPHEWAVGLVDAKGEFISRLPHRPPGTRVSNDFRDAIQRHREGWFRGRTLEGTDTYTAHKTSELTGWTVGVAIPRSEVHAPAYRAGVYMVVGALASLALALAFAYWLARHITAPIAMIGAAARQLGRGPQPPLLSAAKADPRVGEVLEVAAALEEAHAALQERESLRQREQDALRASDKAKDEFLAMLSHELRNPLSAIMASAHVLRLSKPGDEASSKAHAVIDRQARQMSRLVEDLLDVSRLAMGKVTLQRKPLDLAILAERVLLTWQQAGRNRAERTRARLSPAWVDADPARMEQVLANLLNNAEKFSSGQGSIQVSVRGEGAQALLEVQDEGQGIAPEEMPHIFELFMQGAQSLDRPLGGIGLGLTLVKSLAELHGGGVEAFSEGRGRGARFTVRLPLVQGPRAERNAAPATQARPESRRILVVEDNEDGLRMMEAMLELEGHAVRTASTGGAALREAREWQPDIALIDIGLPDIDGYEVARRIRAMALSTPPKLVAISGFGQQKDLRHAYEAGFDLHLTKPVVPEFLRDVVGALTSRQGTQP